MDGDVEPSVPSKLIVGGGVTAGLLLADILALQ
jgi:hypothetical protein